MQNTKKLKRKNRSTMSKSDYLYNHILFNTILVYIYIDLSLIVPIPEFSILNSFLCMMLAALVGIPINIYYNRRWSSIIQDGIIGIGLCTIGILKTYSPTFVKGLLSMTVVLSVISIVPIAVRKTNKQKDISRVVLHKLRGSLRRLQGRL